VGGFSEEQRLVEDVDLLLRLAMAGGQFVFAGNDDPLFFYRRGGPSLSRSDPHRFAAGCVRNARSAEEFWRQGQLALTPKQTVLLQEIYAHALRIFYERDRVSFDHLLAHLEKLNPSFRPAGPAWLSWWSKWVGYRQAEALALAYRRAKRLLRFGFRQLRIREETEEPGAGAVERTCAHRP
jgi:hypothetical protein